MIPWSRDGLELVAEFTDVEAAVLTEFMAQSIELMQSADTVERDPALDRLLPSAYRDDEEAAATFRRSTEASLLEQKLRNAQTVILTTHSGGPVRLSPSEVQSWLRAIADLRLIVASRLGIERDDDLGTGDAFVQDVYQWLGYLQASMLDAMEA